MALHIHHLDHADLPGAVYMGSTAGAEINAGNFHDAHGVCQGDLTAVGESGKLIRGGKACLYGQIRKDRLVGKRFHLKQLFRGEHAVEVQGRDLRSQMEAHVVKAEVAVYQTGEDMLPRMLLHVVKTSCPVHLAGHPGAHRKRGCQKVGQCVLLVDGDMQHRLSVQRTGVAALSALLGEKGCPVENHPVVRVDLLTGEDDSVEFQDMRILVIYFFRHGNKVLYKYYCYWLL